MAEILHFPGKNEPREPIDLAGKYMHEAAANLSFTTGDLLMVPDDRDTRLAAIRKAAIRIKVAQLCLDLALIFESRR